MAFSRTTSRASLTYIRRRPRLGETPKPAAATESTSAPSTSLNLGGASAVAAPAKAAQPIIKRATGRVILGDSEPTVTLTRLQSAVGSLQAELVGSGRLLAFWELTDGTGGVVSASSGTNRGPEYGRRPLVELRAGQLVIGLRHSIALRRVAVLTENSAAAQRLLLTLHDDATVEQSVEQGSGLTCALMIYNIEGELVLRREARTFADEQAALRAYGMTSEWLPPLVR